MRYKPKYAYIGLALLIAGLMCIQAGAIPVSKESETRTPYTATLQNTLITADNPDGDDMHPELTRVGTTLVVIYEKWIGLLESSAPMLYSQDGGETWDMFNELYGSASGAGLVMEPDIAYIPTTSEIIYSAIDPTDEYSACFGWMDGDVTVPTTKFGACWGFGAEATYQALGVLGPWA
ncbi:MAG: hypothetical protein JSV09_16180, partial [Thermoplasmata archaeon]